MRGNLGSVLNLISLLGREQNFTILMVLRKCFILFDDKTPQSRLTINLVFEIHNLIRSFNLYETTFKKVMMGDILNSSASAIIFQISCKELIIKQKYNVANIFSFRVLLRIQLYQVLSK